MRSGPALAMTISCQSFSMNTRGSPRIRFINHLSPFHGENTVKSDADECHIRGKRSHAYWPSHSVMPTTVLVKLQLQAGPPLFASCHLMLSLLDAH